MDLRALACFATAVLCGPGVFAQTSSVLDLGSLEIETSYDKTARLDEDVVAPDERLRVAFLGGTLMDREGRSAYLETELSRLWPERDIVFRNLGWPGDNVHGDARTGFGPGEYRRSGWQPPSEESKDYGFKRVTQQLREARPHVVFVAYGSTVAFEKTGFDRFEKGLIRLLDLLDSFGVRVVLVAPPPRESRGDGWPDMDAQNARLAGVTALLQSVATRRELLFVDSLRLLQEAAVDSTERFTDNGIQLNELGYRRFAAAVTRALRVSGTPWSLRISADGSVLESSSNTTGAVRKSEFGLRFTVKDEQLPSLSSDKPRVLRVEGLSQGSYSLDIGGRRVARGSAKAWAKGVAITRGPDIARAEDLRRAIVDKNRLFFYEFRPQNKAYIYLFRRHERGHHEGEVAQFASLVREKEETIALLRQPRLRHYELVKEKDYPDHEVPGAEPVADVARELERFSVPDGFEVSLFAADPLVTKPIGMNWDERGRLWVATSKIYPHLAPGEVPNDRILILEDIDGDGRADKSTVFAEGLLVPQSVIPGNGGAFVAQSTDLLFLKDNDGDDRADERRLVFTGFGNADVHHMIHGLRWGPDGDLYFTQSIYINSWIETPWGVRRLNGSGIWRLRPELMRLEVHSRGLVNPWGHAFDRWGQSFSTDGAGGGGPSYTFRGSVFKTAKGATRTLNTMNPGRPKECGLEILSGRHLPESWRGNLVTSDFRANRVVRYGLSENGSAYTSRLLGDVLASSHRSFRPVDAKMGPDGAIYIADWYSPIIDHGEVDFHHPLRDDRHGRIWRLTAKGRDLSPPVQLAGVSVRDALAALEAPEDWTRDQARHVLRERGATEVAPELRRWVSALDRGAEGFEHRRLEALWVLQGLRAVDTDLLAGVLTSSDHRVRAAATAVLGDWSRSIDDVEDRFAPLVVDPHPQVRLAAVNALRDAAALGYLEGEACVELALRALDLPLDDAIDFALWSTARERQADWFPRLEEGKPVFGGKSHRLAFALAAVGKEASLRPLVALIEKGEIGGRERAEALELIASLGEPEDLAMVLDRALVELRTDVGAALALFQALEAGAGWGGDTPPNATRIVPLLASGDVRLASVAAELAGYWRLGEARRPLQGIAGGARPAELRYAAARALGKLDGGSAMLRAVVAGSDDVGVKATAIAAWAASQAEPAAKAAADLLSVAKDVENVEILFEAFVGLERGDDHLASALAGKMLHPPIAAAGIRVAGSSGRRLNRLVSELTRAGSLEPITKMPPAAELSAILSAVARDGDAARGEAIFRRDALRCTTCHALGGAGGQVGPDLSSLGGSSQPIHILEALLDPSAKIKEGFESIVVVEATGSVHSGRVVSKSADSLRLRDVKDRVVEIPMRRVVSVAGADASLMPEGMTQTLRRDELVDLVCFLSELGRPGAYSLPNRRFVRTWSVPDASSAASADDDLGANVDALSWKNVFSQLDGSLPLVDIPVVQGGGRCVRFSVEAARPTTLDVGGLRITRLWVDGEARALEGRRIDLDRGTHVCVLRLDPESGSPRIELLDR